MASIALFGVRFRPRWPRARTRRRALRALRSLPLALRVVLGAAVAVALWFTANGVYQVVRKPSELFFPVGGALSKTPPQTWREYAPAFRAHATPVITPALLAALAQVEGAGNPVARTYWRWRPTWHPFELYRPASSAVGMYQITDGTFLEARRYCIHDHVVAEQGTWHDPGSCWFNGLYTRVVPSHAVEMTSALLDVQVARTLQRRGIRERSRGLPVLRNAATPCRTDRCSARGARCAFAAADGPRKGGNPRRSG